MFAIRAPRTNDFPALKALLLNSDLPADDINESQLAHFIILGQSGRIGGSVGIEPFGEDALLRSLAIDPMMRGEGFGGRLLESIEMYARDIGVRRLYLLTTSAAAFFEHHGYQRIDRASAPVAIQNTSQFAHLCPASSICLSKSLA